MSLKERERKLVIRANERGREREQATEKVRYKSTHTETNLDMKHQRERRIKQ